MKTLKFNKEDNKWYIDIPEWQGSKADLEMVSGADDLLEYLADNKDTVSIIAFEDIPSGPSICLEKSKDLTNGADYKVFGCDAVDELWLCDVTKYVYGYMPDFIFVKLAI